MKNLLECLVLCMRTLIECHNDTWNNILKHLWYCANIVSACYCIISGFWMGPEDDIAAKECVWEFLHSILQRWYLPCCCWQKEFVHNLQVSKKFAIEAKFSTYLLKTVII